MLIIPGPPGRKEGERTHWEGELRPARPPPPGPRAHSAASAAPCRRWPAAAAAASHRAGRSPAHTPPRPGTTSWGCGRCGCWCCAWPSRSGGAAPSSPRCCRWSVRSRPATRRSGQSELASAKASKDSNQVYPPQTPCSKVFIFSKHIRMKTESF